MKLSRRKIAAMAIAARDNAVMVRRSFVLDVIGFTTRRNILANAPSSATRPAGHDDDCNRDAQAGLAAAYSSATLDS